MSRIKYTLGPQRFLMTARWNPASCQAFEHYAHRRLQHPALASPVALYRYHEQLLAVFPWRNDTLLLGEPAPLTSEDVLRATFNLADALSHLHSYGVVLHRMIPLGEGGRAEEAHVEAFFPGGQSRPTSVDVDFPDVFASGTWPRRFKIRGAEVHLRGVVAGDQVFPASEAFRFEFGLFGWWGSGAQTIVYEQIKPCPAAASPE